MSDLIRIMLSTVIFAALVGFVHIARAEYYMEFPEPPITQTIKYSSPHHDKTKAKKHHVYKKKPRYSHYEITVTYIWPVCPGCACAEAGYCYPNDEQLNKRAVMGNGGGAVNFSYENKRFNKLRNGYDTYETYDMRTADDDVMRDPNMNNQYNQF